MEELKFSLMHKDNPVCAITVDASSGAILRVSKPVNPELLPVGGNIDAEKLRNWWQRRAVPVGQGKIMRILEKAGISSTQAYLVKNWGLSLTDHYWIKPHDFALGWNEVNLFNNPFVDPVGDMQFTEAVGDTVELPANAFSPSSTLQGALRKKWIIKDGKRYLVKANHGNNSQESLNEVVATLLHHKQQKQPFVTYSPIRLDNNCQLYCICESFTSDTVELISAYDLIESQKRPNDRSYYDHFIHLCAQHGLCEDVVRPFLEYQILTDFVITNTDRHLRNIGVLRDTNTLQFIAMAPIFDSGNSMFYQNPQLPLIDDLMNIGVTSFKSKEIDLLKYVHDTDLVDGTKLPSIEELKNIYEKDELITYADAILLGYQKKIDILTSLGKL